MALMDLLSVVFIALGLSADCFAVSLGVGAAARSFRLKLVLRMALAFGLFQLGMPLIGWMLGQTVVDIISGYDHWVAFALLAFVGGRMLWEFVQGSKESEIGDISKWGTLLTLAVATSIDALAVGLSLAFLKISIALASGIIGFVAFCVTLFGYWLAGKASGLIGRWALLAGAVILLGIGVRILVVHMIGQ